MNRLESIAPTLWIKITKLTQDARANLVLAACKHALEESGLKDAVVLESYTQLEEGKLLSEVELNKLRLKTDELHEKYLSESANESADRTHVSALFKQARAASAISFAAQKGALDAAAESIYEASVISDDEESYWNLIESLLGSGPALV